MGIDNRVVDKTGETLAELQGSAKSTGFENVKHIFFDKFHDLAEAQGEKAADRDTQSGMDQYGKQASEWLDQSAEYLRQLDYEQADANVREYVGQSPGRSLLIAGAVGLIMGVIFRRR